MITCDDSTQCECCVCRLIRDRDEACEGESLRAQERDAVRRERDRLRLIVMEMAARGCTTFSDGLCRTGFFSRDHWCLSCRAAEALEEK